MQVKGVKRADGQPGALVMLDTAPEEHTLGLLMPNGEAERVARALGLTPCRCLPIYDLIADILGHCGGAIRHALLDAHPDGVAAALSFERARAPFTVGCHPADAIALALRAEAPIYATAAALALACRTEGPCQHREPRDRVREWLDGVGARGLRGPRLPRAEPVSFPSAGAVRIERQRSGL
jgi:bifunctional DNase/RNase